MIKLIKQNGVLIAGGLLGALAGYLYWKFAGCLSGSCAITGRPLNSTLYGAVVGGVLFSLFKRTS